MTAPINFQAIQTIYALEHNKESIYLPLSPIFLTEFNFNFSAQSLLEIQAKLIETPRSWNEDELRCLTFYIIEVLARIKSYQVTWNGDFMDYYATFMRNHEIITEIPVFKNLDTNGIFDLIFNTSQTLNINLIELKDDQTQQKFKRFKDTQHLKLLPDRESDYPTTKMPSWCTSEQDTLYGYFSDIPKLLKYGFKIKANIVQANNLLFDPSSSINCPAEVVFDLENRLTYSDLESISKYLFGLRARPKESLTPQERSYANHLNDERERSFSYQLPEAILGYPLYISTIFIDRNHLPTPAIVSGNIEIFINYDISRYVMLCPAQFWDQQNKLYWEHLQRLESTEEDHSPLDIKKPYLIRIVHFLRQHIGLSFICFLLFIVIVLR